MVTIVIDVTLLRRLAIVAVLVGVATAGLWAARSAWAGVDDPPLPEVAVLARADNPVDALAASGVAGQLGAPVFLTFPDTLGQDAADGLAAADPDVVVLAGGTAALSEAVESQVAALLPDAQVIRKAGDSRTATAVALNDLPAELGFDRPVLAGATVPGDVGIGGELTVAGVDVAAAITDLQAQVDSLQADLAAATDRVTALEATLAGVDRDGDVLTFGGMNVRVVNGQGATATTNGLGNLIVGYGEDHTDRVCVPSDDDCQYVTDSTADVRTGSHNLVVGEDHTYTSFGGLIAGRNNIVEGLFASVSGGGFNTASGFASSVSGGAFNTASEISASVSGGYDNTASGSNSSVSGGRGNTASGSYTSVSGGQSNTASENYASVSGGANNTAGANWSTVAGGEGGELFASITSDRYDTLVGNSQFPDAP